MKRTEWMYTVKVHRGFIVKGRVVTRWEVAPVTEVERDEDYVCAHCDGEVRLHKGKSVPEHAEHKRTEDSEKCAGGVKGKTNKRPAKRPSDRMDSAHP